MLSPAETQALDDRVAAVEAATGVEIVAAVIDKADAYVELPWKAFALGASLAAAAMVMATALRADWPVPHAALVHAVAILGTGAAGALVAIFVPPFARLFLRAARRDVEVRQYAQSLFLERQLFRTRDRTGILLLVSLFERKVEVLPDIGYRDRVADADWNEVVLRMTPLLRGRRSADALLEGLAGVALLLNRKGFHADGRKRNELPDAPVAEAGA